MPEARDAKPHTSPRSAAHAPSVATRDAEVASRDAEVASLDALIDRLVPALTAKLSASHLGELEVREGEWRIRLRRPAGTRWNGELRRASDRTADRIAERGSDRGSRGQPGHDAHGHDAHGHGRPAVDSHRVPTPGGSNGSGPAAKPGATAGTGLAAAASVPPSTVQPPRSPHDDEGRRVATSPAVGVFRPGPRATVGTRVREGDVLGHIDVLGVPEDVPAPADGMVSELLVEGGTAVEYGQELVLVAAQASAEAGRP